MKRKMVRTRVLVLHYRPLMARIVVACLFVMSVWLLSTSKNPNSLGETVRLTLADVITPVVNVLAKPVDSVASLKDWAHELTAIRAENRELKEENARLKEWYSATAQLKDENEKLRALLKFAPVGKPAYTSARITVNTASPYSRSALITSGIDSAVQADSAVISDQGMIGRVIEVGKKTSRVLLLTDINSRIPVMAENSLEHAVAAGNGSDTLSLLYLPESSSLKVGEKIVTSGDGALIPPGLPVGIVSKIENNVATLKPFADWYRLEYVSVINF